jgi:hypothetical protein
VVGFGFGGTVAVLEIGRRLRDEDFAKTGWNLRRMFWLPSMDLVGPSRISVFKDIFIASGAGVGAAAALRHRRAHARFADRALGQRRAAVAVQGGRSLRCAAQLHTHALRRVLRRCKGHCGRPAAPVLRALVAPDAAVAPWVAMSVPRTRW